MTSIAAIIVGTFFGVSALTCVVSGFFTYDEDVSPKTRSVAELWTGISFISLCLFGIILMALKGP